MNKQRKVLITITYNEMGIIIDTKAEEVAQPDLQPNLQPTLATDTISRQAAIDAVDSETVSTNPEHFKSSEKFIKFMDDVDIASFGKWQWANGFNTALVATRVQLKQLPSAEPEIIRCKDCKHHVLHPRMGVLWCTFLHSDMGYDQFCSYAERRGEEE